MRRLFVLAVSALLCVGVTQSYLAVADSGSDYTNVRTTSTMIIGVSGDARVVVTADYGSIGNTTVTDRSTGTSRLSPSQGNRLSADGTHLVLVTRDVRDPADTDSDEDVYSVRISDGASRLLTLGLAGWHFEELGGVSADGSIAIVRGTNGNLASTAPFVADGTTTTELGTSLGEGHNGVAFDISDDGRVVIYATSRCAAPGPNMSGCRDWGLFREDRITHTIVEVAQDSAGNRMQISDAIISGDGSCVAAMSTARFVYKNCTLQPRGMVLQTADVTAGSFRSYRNSFSITRDGATVAWVQLFDGIHTPDGYQVPQLFARTASGTPRIISMNHGQPDQFGVGAALISDDGAVAVMETYDPAYAERPDWVPVVVTRSLLPPGQPVPPTTTTAPPTTMPATIPPTTAPAPPPPPGPSGPLPGAAVAVAGASVFVPLQPLRIVDTRTHLGSDGPMPQPGSLLRIPVRGQYGLADDATAVAIQLTATGGTSAGYVSAVPTGAAGGQTSTINIDAPGETLANMAVVPIGDDGSITIASDAATHLLVDLSGSWRPASTAVSAGRYRPIGPVRILDTRLTSKPTAASTLTLQIAGQNGVPALGVSAAIVNITIVDPAAGGFVQAGPADGFVVGQSSTLNADTAGQVIAAAAIVPVDANGRIAIHTQSAAHLVVDLGGWFTDDAVTAGVDGMFVPFAAPRRDVDTRFGTGARGPTSSGTHFDIAASGGALVGNATIVANAGPGYLQLGPTSGMSDGQTSNVNASTASETIANGFIVPLCNGLGVFTSTATHVLVDVSGYMTDTEEHCG